jgi:hypothetical protein
MPHVLGPAGNPPPGPCDCRTLTAADADKPISHIHIRTSYGPLAVPTSVVRHWDRYGWPSDGTLREMVHDQQKENHA